MYYCKKDNQPTKLDNNCRFCNCDKICRDCNQVEFKEEVKDEKLTR
jgi:hypothetical protein